MSPKAPTPRRILVIRNRYLGDTVLAIPALRNLRAAFPDARIDVMVEPVAGDVLRHCPYIDELIYVRIHKPRKPVPGMPVGVWQIARHLRGRHYDRVYVLRRAFSAALIARLAGIPHRVGFSDGGTWLLHSRSAPIRDNHEVETFLDVLRADEIPVVDTHNENWVDEASEQSFAKLAPKGARRRVFLFARATIPDKDWDLDRVTEVCRHLIERHGMEIHACDAPSNAGYYAEVASRLPESSREHLHDWSTVLPLASLGALLRTCSLGVGVDTGLMHVAASFGLPIVVLFGDPSPKRWHPWGVPHRILRPVVHDCPRPLLAVQASEVIAAIDTFLGEQLS